MPHDLPPEILEKIFAHIPLVDLLTVHSRVSHKWYDIISRPNYLPWKKAYYQYKLQPHYGKDEVIETILEDEDKKRKAAKQQKENDDDETSDEGVPPIKKQKVEPEPEKETLYPVYEKLYDFFKIHDKDGKYENAEFINFDNHLNPPRKDRNGRVCPEDKIKWRNETGLPFLVSFRSGLFLILLSTLHFYLFSGQLCLYKFCRRCG